MAEIIASVEGEGIPTFRVSGVVGESFKGADLAAAIEQANKTHGAAKVILESVGGDTADAFYVYDYVRANRLKLFVDIYGRAASAATIIAAAAGLDRIRIAPNAQFLIHDATGGTGEELELVNAKLAKVYADLSGMPVEKARKLMREDTVKDAEWAVKMNLAGSFIKLEKLAAAAVSIMSDQPKTRKIVIGHKAILAAAFTADGSVEVAESEFTVSDADKVKTLDEQIAALTKERDELKVKAETVPALETAKTEAEGKLVAMTTERDKFQAQVEALKKNPLVAQVIDNGTAEVVVPGTVAETKPEESKEAQRIDRTRNAYEDFKKRKYSTAQA